MEMYLQFGHGMMAHASELITQWGGGGVILSPRDLTEAQIVRTSNSVREAGGESLIDPQCFARDCDHKRLLAHPFWAKFRSNPTGSFYGGAGTSEVLSELALLNSKAGVIRHILPGSMANPLSEDWFAFEENMIDEAPTHFGDAPLLATIALSAQTVRSEVDVESIVERAGSWPVEGVYIIAEHPEGYLVEDPSWLANLLILVSGLKLAGKVVIIGYCSHQMLCLASAKADIIASGTWLNVRSFPIDKFYTPDEDDVSRRATWYYCPQALSEYKVPFLDIAFRQGCLMEMAPPPELGSSYGHALFTGATPTSVAWSEQSAFRHYLTSLRAQSAIASRPSLSETVNTHLGAIDAAEILLQRLARLGVRGQDRDFAKCIDVTRAAVAVFMSARETRLSRAW